MRTINSLQKAFSTIDIQTLITMPSWMFKTLVATA